MSILDQFSDEQKELIVSLPYKAGIWVSYSDDVDGDDDDAAEMDALGRSLEAVAGLHETSPLCTAVASAIVDNQAKWPVWKDACFSVVRQAPEAVNVIHSALGAGEAKEYRAMVMEITKSVAQAHSEWEAFDDDSNDKEGFFGNIIGKITGGFAGMSSDDEGHPANISAAEDAALSELSAALKISA